MEVINSSPSNFKVVHAITMFILKAMFYDCCRIFSLYFNPFSVKSDKPKCSYWRTNGCCLFLSIKTMLQVSYLNLYKSFEMMCLGDISLKRKVLFILLDGLENTFSVIFFWQDWRMSFNCFLNLKDIFPKYCKVIRTSFFVHVRFWWLRLMNNLLRNFWTHLSIKNNRNEFF